ncbi:MAG: hypothetical protein WEC59_06370 [Salibacteraceae bacterium]
MIHVSSLAQNKPKIPGTKRNSISFFHENHVFSKDQKKISYLYEGNFYGFPIFPGFIYKRSVGEARKNSLSIAANYLSAWYAPLDGRNYQSGDTKERRMTTANLAWHHSLVRNGSFELESSVGMFLRERVDFAWYPGLGFHNFMLETYHNVELGAIAGVQVQRYLGKHFLLYGAAHASQVIWRNGGRHPGEPDDKHIELTQFGISYRLGIGYTFGEGLPIPERE